MITRRRHSITVIHNAGSSSNLRLRASYDAAARADHPALASASGDAGYRQPSRQSGVLVAPRPLGIVLRSDRPKEISTAHETGDRAFDQAVFVDTATSDRAVLEAILGPELRAGVLALFELGFLRVTIDEEPPLGGPGAVEASLWSFASAEPPPQQAARCLDAFASILDNLPKISSSGEAPKGPAAPAWLTASTAVGLVGLLAIWPACWLAGKAKSADDGAPQAIALVAATLGGLIVSWASRGALTRHLGSPRAGATARILVGRVKIFLGAATLVFVAVLAGMLLARW